MKKLLNKVFLLVVLLLINSSNIVASKETEKELSSIQLYKKTIILPGEGEFALEIYESINDTLIVELRRYKNLIQKAITIGNASIKDELIQKVNLDGKGGKEYFLTVYDRSSTYGHQTNIIIWKEGIWWNMLCAPFERGFIEDRNKDGIFEIINYYPNEKIYNFHRGLFIEYKGTN
jgi:hypothetical protein